MPLIEVELPRPGEMRGGWAAKAALYAAYGWGNNVYATDDLWYYHDGGGNWACIRFTSATQAVLFGHDHEYSETYFREAASFFGKEETDLLKDAPSWWGEAIESSPDGPWIGFIYGWDGKKWQRAEYDNNDGFDKVALLSALKVTGPHSLSESVDFFELPVVENDIQMLVDSDGAITEELLNTVMPGYDVNAGVAAANRFLLVDLN